MNRSEKQRKEKGKERQIYAVAFQFATWLETRRMNSLSLIILSFLQKHGTMLKVKMNSKAELKDDIEYNFSQEES